MAITITSTELETLIGVDPAVAVRLLGVASALVNQYCASCPDAIANEATIRTSAYLKDGAPHATLQRLESGASVELEYQKPSGRSALRFSGAMSLLSPYKRRRAMVVT